MHAELLIRHGTLSSESLKSILAAKFNNENRHALKESPLFNSGKWDDVVLYSTETPSYRLFGVPTQDEELQIYIEPVTGNMVQICESVWRGTKKALNKSSPKLSSLKLVDNESGKDILTATTSSMGHELRQREAVSPLVVGLAAGAYSIVGIFTFAAKDGAKFLAGAVTGVAAAVVAVVLAFVAAREGKLSWK